jgi:glucosylceramidase
MKEKTHCELSRLIGITFVLGSILVFSQCKRSNDSGIAVYYSSQDGDRLAKETGLQFTFDKESSLPVIKIDEGTLFQKIDGFGATFNEAGIVCLNSLSTETQDSVLKTLFDPDSGAGYTLMKSPITA